MKLMTGLLQPHLTQGVAAGIHGGKRGMNQSICRIFFMMTE
ncbi:MAG: hypothetical protein RQ714_01050 [Nitrosomonas sp.]|nr:hypothetical protein [Nitrosomonas sp.]